MNYTWAPGNYTYGMKAGYDKLSSFGSIVPAKIQLEALKAVASLQNGSLVVFKSPLKDRDGKERIAQDKLADLQTLETMNWLVPGVEGVLDKH